MSWSQPKGEQNVPNIKLYGQKPEAEGSRPGGTSRQRASRQRWRQWEEVAGQKVAGRDYLRPRRPSEGSESSRFQTGSHVAQAGLELTVYLRVPWVS